MFIYSLYVKRNILKKDSTRENKNVIVFATKPNPSKYKLTYKRRGITLFSYSLYTKV